MSIDRRPHHQALLGKLEAQLAGNTERIRIKKKTVSNLFRYEGRAQSDARMVDLGELNQPLYIDITKRTLEVQGLTTYESIVDFTLPRGLLPTITPELKHITVGGATVGVGIESNSFRYGFVHDSLLEADVLLPDGRIITCSPDNEYADLFYGLANSYGTLGYILRAKLQLRPAKRYVRLATQRFDSTKAFLAAAKAATQKSANTYVESLIYSPTELYLVVGQDTNEAQRLTSIYGRTIFYRQLSQPGKLWLTTRDYLFRYDPEWFWALPESRFYRGFRALAPRGLRNSSFYTRYVAWAHRMAEKYPFLNIGSEDPRLEQLIQDWEVPWNQGQALIDFALEKIDLEGRPWMVVPVRTPARASGYPLRPNELYLNLGSYSFAKKLPKQPAYATTKLLDEFCFGHGGLKMLYSTSFLSEPEFSRLYAGVGYAKLKTKYDPAGLFPTLYDKVVKAR